MLCSETIESCVVKVSCEDYSAVIVGIYSPHSDSIDNFTDSIINLLNDGKLRNCPCGWGRLLGFPSSRNRIQPQYPLLVV